MGAGEAAPGPNDLSPWEDIVGSPRRAAQPSTQARRLQHKRPSNLGVIFALGLTGAAALLAIVVWLAPRHEGETVDESALAEKQSPQSNRRQASHRAESDDDRPVRIAAIAPVPSRPTEDRRAAEPEPAPAPRPIMPGPPEKPAVVKADAGNSSGRPIFEKTAEPVEKPAGPPAKPAVPSFDLSGGGRTDHPAAPPAAKKRLPVPDDSTQEKIAAQLAQVYAPSRAKTPAEKTRLAYKILQAAKASKSPEERYVLLGQGRGLASQAGDAALVLQVIEMTGEFEVDVPAVKGRAILALAEKAGTAEQVGALFSASQGVIADALSAGRAELASEVAQGVYSACLRSKEYRKKALDQRDQVQDYCRRLAERQAAEARLQANPDDADAHLALGRNLCLGDDWKSGLPHLAKGSDRDVRQLAERDLASPSEPAERMELADGWWTLGKAHQGDDRDLLLLRAGFWYELAHANLSSGLERLKAEKRLEELAEVRQRRAAGDRLLHPEKDPSRDLWNGLF